MEGPKVARGRDQSKVGVGESASRRSVADSRSPFWSCCISQIQHTNEDRANKTERRGQNRAQRSFGWLAAIYMLVVPELSDRFNGLSINMCEEYIYSDNAFDCLLCHLEFP